MQDPLFLLNVYVLDYCLHFSLSFYSAFSFCRINFLKTCRILLDSSTQLLRRVLREEAQMYGRKVPGELVKKDFSWLVSELIDPETRLKSGRRREAFPGLFFELASSQVTLSDVDELSPHYGKNWTEVTVQKWTEVTVQEGAETKVEKWSEKLRQDPPRYNTVIVNLQKSGFKPSGMDDVLYLKRKPSREEKRMNNIQMYFGTKKYDAVDRLRELRNKKVGHPKNVSMSDADFDTLVSEVKKLYEILTNDEESIQEPQKIKDGKARFPFYTHT